MSRPCDGTRPGLGEFRSVAGSPMCGIAGAIDPVTQRARDQVNQINSGQAHRGPDHQTIASSGMFTLGSTRLAIQDPSPAGNQPFTSADGRFICVFNGEIYNYRRLIKRYELPVQTGCDGEVIVRLWAKLGEDALTELRGMFAIALADTLEERLYLVRDPFGIKPLYWRVPEPGRLLFGSEVRPLARASGPVRIDPQSVGHYLWLGAMAADQSPFQEITALPPNSVAVFDSSGQLAIREIRPGGPVPVTDPAEDLGVVLADSVDLHLAADVPVALLLSAGTDSSAIAAAGRNLGRHLNCLTVACPGADESAEAEATARHYGHGFQRVPAALEHRDVSVFFTAMQRPSIDGLNTYLVSRAVHQAGFKVALSGLGGDEAVGGYSHFRLLRHLPALRVLQEMPDPLTGLFAKSAARLGLASRSKAARLMARHGPRDGAGLSLLQREVLPAAVAIDLTGAPIKHYRGQADLRAMRDLGPLGTMTAAEISGYLQTTLLPDADAFSMASSVELRVPFVDGPVFRAALAASPDRTRPPGKAAIGAALGDPYLQAIAARPKRGFSVPMRAWMGEAGPLGPVLSQASDPAAAVWSVLDRKRAERAGLLPVHVQQRWAESWLIAALNAWLETVESR
jgi:asparagine synthase (glutamine-hydrolysing)